MLEEIRPDLYRLEIPLPDSPLKYLNSYVIRSKDRNLIVDTGLNRKECLEAMHKGLTELDIDLAKTDFFITHLHADHFGLVGKLVQDNSAIFFNRPETELVEAWVSWDPMVNFAGKNGFPKNELRLALEAHPGHKFASDWVPDLNILRDGDGIQVGDYHFQCVFTPGHSMGHMCLYERKERALFSGDHILFDITPNISLWSDEEDPLSRYLESLKMVKGMDIERTLPGHRSRMGDPTERIDELTRHHHERAEEVLSILEDGPLDPFTTASRMKWDMTYDSFDDFPIMQKWFALGEAIAHLKFLETTGRAERLKGERVRYRNI